MHDYGDYDDYVLHLFYYKVKSQLLGMQWKYE